MMRKSFIEKQSNRNSFVNGIEAGSKNPKVPSISGIQENNNNINPKYLLSSPVYSA